MPFLNSRIEKGQLALLAFLCIIFCSTFYNRYIQSDENWVAEQAYWLVEDGQVKLKSIPGIFNWASYFLAYHKFFVWITAAIYSIFGMSLYAFKTYTLIVFIGCIILVTHHYIKNGASKKFLLLPAILFISTPVMIVKGFELRPEPTLMLIGFVSFIFLEKSREKNKIIDAILAGVFAGLTFLTHLNGLIFCVAGFIYLLYFKSFKAIFLYVIFGALIGGLYFTHMLSIELFNEWLYNLKNWPSHDFSKNVEGSGVWSFISNYASKLASEHKRYFWDHSIMSTSILFLSILIIMFKVLWEKHRGLVLYTIVSLFFLALLGSSKSPRYLVFFLPFIVLVIGYGINYLYQLKYKLRKRFTYFLIAIGVFQIGSAVAIANYAWNISFDYKKENREILSAIPEESKVLGPWELILTDIDNYQLYNYKTYEYLQEREEELFTQLDVFEIAYVEGIEYIILTHEIIRTEAFRSFQEREVVINPYYKMKSINDDFFVLERK